MTARSNRLTTSVVHGRWQDNLPNTIDCVVSDPPYNTTGCSWDGKFDAQEFWSLITPRLAPQATVVLTCTMRMAVELINTATIPFRHDLVWEKPNGTGQVNLSPNRVHEQILVFGSTYYRAQLEPGKPYAWHSTRTRGEATGYTGSEPIQNHGTRHPRSVLHIAQQRGHHPTQKPVELFEFLIRSYCDPQWCVFDPFCGSGTTLVAASELGRSSVGIEQLKEYVKITEARLDEINRFTKWFDQAPR